MKLLPVFLLLAVLSACPAASETPHAVISSGRVNTQGKFSFMYGSVEASIKAPHTANGLWPAFWLLGADYETSGWPGCGEIDIMEMGGYRGIQAGIQDRYMTGGCHWGEILSGNGDANGGGHPNYNLEVQNPVSLQDDFHVYRMVWDGQKISMYLDGALYFEMNINVFDGPWPAGDYFNKPFFILFNLAVGGDYPGLYQQSEISALNSKNNYSAAMYVDYVRVRDEQGNLIWEDDFSGPGLDKSKWNIEVNDLGGGNRELQSYRQENVEVGKEPVTGKNCLILRAAIH